MTFYLPLILGTWVVIATLTAVLLVLEVGVLRRRIEFLKALADGKFDTVDRMMGIASQDRHALPPSEPQIGRDEVAKDVTTKQI